MKIGYALMLNNECHNFIRKTQFELHQEVGIGMPRQSPHITIKSPFKIDRLDEYVTYFDHLAANTPAIDITMNSIGFFDEKVIYLEVEQKQELLDWHFKILADMKARFDVNPDPYEGESIKFHASIAGFNKREEFVRAKTFLSNLDIDLHFRAVELGLFYHLGEGESWIVQRRSLLEGQM
ncbi:2'-5' RNA ligase family protein [Portibacter marinus]|uniref:2'-5' RNA ligase family protein n=1 Tax=Portibacter marinus TaxID=2898660 RepID=UPI001F27D2C3|nr:2'-5' RNA ligase family protein [Portibacter marinus]